MINEPRVSSHRPCGLGPVTGFLFRVVGMHLLRYGLAFTHRQCRINSNGSRG